MEKHQAAVPAVGQLHHRSVINKGGTTAPDLIPIIEEIDRLCRLYKADLATSHIPGVLNTRADVMSRWVGSRARRWRLDDYGQDF